MSKAILFFLILLSFSTALLEAQQPPPSTKPSVQSPSSSTSLPQAPQGVDTEIALLREKVDAVAGRTNLLITILAAVLAFGGITSLISWGRYEFSQARREHKQSDETHALLVRGETGSQRRSDEVHQTFLAGSKNTLDLVNATLTLAKEASERAAKAVEARAAIILQKLDIESKELLASVPGQDDRALVADPARTATLRSLAQRIEGFQINRLVLPEEMQLSTECLFIRGMDFHLRQQYDDAFEAWKEVAHRNETPPSLRSKAWYWIGYEQNNLGDFPDACLSFQRALETASGVRKFELQRLLVESRFFNRDAEESLIESLKALLTSIEQNAEEGVESVRKRILGTLGNIYLQMGNHLRKTTSLEGSKPKYELAKSYFEQASAQDKWALFGFAEALYWLCNEQALDIFEKQVRPSAISEEIRRIEPRTKVLAKTTELICCIRVPALRAEVLGVCRDVTDSLGRVEGRLTVYSQSQRRNVTKEDFRNDLEELMKEYRGYTRPHQP